MGFLDKGVDKARARQKASILEEAAAAGSQVVEVANSEDGSTAASVVGGILTSLVGGTVEHDSFQIFVLKTKDLSHIYVQPYDGLEAVLEDPPLPELCTRYDRRRGDFGEA